MVGLANRYLIFNLHQVRDTGFHCDTFRRGENKKEKSA